MCTGLEEPLFAITRNERISIATAGRRLAQCCLPAALIAGRVRGMVPNRRWTAVEVMDSFRLPSPAPTIRRGRVVGLLSSSANRYKWRYIYGLYGFYWLHWGLV